MSVFPLRRRARAGGPPLDIVAALPIPVVVLDADGAVTVANAAAETFFNLSQASLCERGLAAGLAPDAALMALILAARAESKDFIAYDHEIALAGGKTARADVFVTPLPDASAGTLVTLAAARCRGDGRPAARRAGGGAVGDRCRGNARP